MDAKEFSKKLKESYEKMTPEEEKKVEIGIQEMEKSGLFRLANNTEE